MSARRVRSAGLTLNAELSGPPGAPVICLNHCFASDHRYWDFHLDAFEGFQVLRFDARGHGDSDAPPGPYDLQMMASDIADLCDALEVPRIHLCGVSMGGQVAQTFALAHPQRLASLILVNTTCEYAVEQTQLWRERAKLALDEGIDAVLEALMARWFTDDAARQRIPGYRYMEESIRRFEPTSFAAACEAMCGLHTTPRLHEIEVPTLIIAAPEDPGAPREVSQKMARLITRAELHWLEPARHLSSLEHPERFNDIVREFLGTMRMHA